CTSTLVDHCARHDSSLYYCFIIPRSPKFTPFPYTTLFRSPSQEPEKTPEKCPCCVTGAQKGACMRTGLTKQEKTTDIWFDEKDRSEEHTSELQSRFDLVCRLLLEKKNRYPCHCCMSVVRRH